MVSCNHFVIRSFPTYSDGNCVWAVYCFVVPLVQRILWAFKETERFEEWGSLRPFGVEVILISCVHTLDPIGPSNREAFCFVGICAVTPKRVEGLFVHLRRFR